MNFADLHPIASASLPWQLVLAIIAFNIVAGMISKRKQGKAKPGAKPATQADARKAEAQREKDNSRNLEIMRRQAEARAREAAEAKRKGAEREARQAREEDQRARAPERPVVPKEIRRVESAMSKESAERERIAEADSRPTPAPVAMPLPARNSQAIGPGDLTDPEVLRKAFILKIILDKPLALAPRR